MCAFWHKPCIEARKDCNFWIELQVTTVNKLGIKQVRPMNQCIFFATFVAASNPRIVMQQPMQQPQPRGMNRGKLSN
jgi:hypothetical protein